MTEVVLKNVSKRFGNVVAVNSLNLEVKDKEFLILIGPSGCGKNTIPPKTSHRSQKDGKKREKSTSNKTF